MQRTLIFKFCLLLALLLPGISRAAEAAFTFGKVPFEETAVVNEKDGQYVVICSFKPHGNPPERMKAAFYLQKAKGICLKGIASFRRGQAVTRASGSVKGMQEIKEHEQKDGKLIYYFQVASFTEK